MRDDADDEEQAPWLMRDTSWSRLGLPLAAGLLALTPAVSRRATRTTLLTYLQLPIYMLHQYEEHGHGAFKREINALVPPSIGHLTDRTIFWVNIASVWGVDAVVTALAASRLPAAGLVAPYLAAVNGAIHLGMALRQRRYNHGLGTALALFLPFGLYSIRAIGRDAGATRRAHLAALGVTLALHLLVMVGVLRGRQPARP
jgi:hypothetical protein